MGVFRNRVLELLFCGLLAMGISASAQDPAPAGLKIKLVNPGAHAATTRSNGKDTQLAPKKVRSIQTPKDSYVVEFWSGDPAQGWKKQTITQSGDYAFRLEKGQFFLDKKGAAPGGVAGGAPLKFKLINPNPHAAHTKADGKTAKLEPNKVRNVETQKIPYNLEYWSGDPALGWKKAAISKSGDYAFRLDDKGQYFLEQRAPAGRPGAGNAGGRPGAGRPGSVAGSVIGGDPGTGGAGGTPVFLLPSQGNLNPALFPNLNAMSPALGQLMRDAGAATQNQINANNAHKDAQLAVKDAQIAELKADKAAADAQKKFDDARARTRKAANDLFAAPPGTDLAPLIAALNKAAADERLARGNLDKARKNADGAKAKLANAQKDAAKKKTALDAANKNKLALCEKLVAHLLRNGLPRI